MRSDAEREVDTKYRRLLPCITSEGELLILTTLKVNNDAIMWKTLSRWLKRPTDRPIDRDLTHSSLGQTDQIDHDLDHLYLNVPLADVVQGMYSTGRTQETCPR